jgi:hypothetical protein
MKRTSEKSAEKTDAKKTKVTPLIKTQMYEDLEKLVPNCAWQITSHTFTIAAIAESGSGKSAFLSSLFNALCALGNDHPFLFPTKERGQFSTCTKIPVLVSYSKNWEWKFVQKGFGQSEWDRNKFTFPQGFAFYKKLIEEWNNKTPVPNGYLHLTCPFTYPIELIDMPVDVSPDNPIFGRIIDAVVTFTQSTITLAHMKSIMNNLRGNLSPPMIILVKDTSYETDMIEHNRALSDSLLSHYYDLDLMHSTRGNMIVRSRDFRKLYQTFTFTGRFMPWHKHPQGVIGWIMDLHMKSSINIIEEKFYGKHELIQTPKSEEKCVQKYSAEAEFKNIPAKNIGFAVSTLCRNRLPGKNEFIAAVETLLKSFAVRCMFDVALQWALKHANVQSHLFREITEFVVIDGMIKYWPGLQDELNRARLDRLITEYASKNVANEWIPINLFHRIRLTIQTAFTDVATSMQMTPVREILYTLSASSVFFQLKGDEWVASIEKEKESFVDKYFNKNCIFNTDSIFDDEKKK